MGPVLPQGCPGPLHVSLGSYTEKERQYLQIGSVSPAASILCSGMQVASDRGPGMREPRGQSEMWLFTLSRTLTVPCWGAPSSCALNPVITEEHTLLWADWGDFCRWACMPFIIFSP